MGKDNKIGGKKMWVKQCHKHHKPPMTVFFTYKKGEISGWWRSPSSILLRIQDAETETSGESGRTTLAVKIGGSTNQLTTVSFFFFAVIYIYILQGI